MTVFAPRLAWTGERFESGVHLRVVGGRIIAIERPGDRADELPRSSAPADRDANQQDRVDLPDHALVPGFVNAHSHAFQRGLRGRGETFPAGAGSFWTWREAMYELVGSVDPDRLFALCRTAFEEMLAAGITTVGEFHYLHHLGPLGQSGEGSAAWDGDRIVRRAARAAGIRLVLLQTAYTAGGFGRPLEPGQARFDTRDAAAYWRQLDRLTAALEHETAEEGRAALPRQHLGIAAHSLRAVPTPLVSELFDGARDRGLPLHLHLEEQRREIEACRVAHGRTPLRLLLDTLDRGDATDLRKVVAVHCTHSDPDELRHFLTAGGGVCLCPTTEANLGDGVPDPSPWLAVPGHLSLGTDSNARLSMLEEMRWAELGQRLAREQRGVLVDASRRGARETIQDATGQVAAGLLDAATAGGARALGLDSGRLAVGALADFAAIDLEHPSLRHTDEDTLAEALVFGCGNAVIDGVWVAGGAVCRSRHTTPSLADDTDPDDGWSGAPMSHFGGPARRER